MAGNDDDVELMDVDDDDALNLSTASPDKTSAMVEENQNESLADVLKSLQEDPDERKKRNALLIYGVQGFSSFDVEVLVEPVQVQVDFHEENQWCIVHFPSEAETLRALIELTHPLVITETSAPTSIPKNAVQMPASDLPRGVEKVGPWRIFKPMLLKKQCRFLITRFATDSERRVVTSKGQDVLRIDEPVLDADAAEKTSRNRPAKIVYGDESRIERELARRGQPSLMHADDEQIPVPVARRRLESGGGEDLRAVIKRTTDKTNKIVKHTPKVSSVSSVAALHLKDDIRSRRLLGKAAAGIATDTSRQIKTPGLRSAQSGRRVQPIAASTRPADETQRSRLPARMQQRITRRHRSAGDDDDDAEDAGAAVAARTVSGGGDAVMTVGRSDAVREDVLVVDDDREHARSTRTIEGGKTFQQRSQSNDDDVQILPSRTNSGPAAVSAAAAAAASNPVPMVDLRDEIDFRRYARQRLTNAQLKRQQEIIEQQQHYQEMARAYEKRQTTANYDNDLF